LRRGLVFTTATFESGTLYLCGFAGLRTTKIAVFRLQLRKSG